MQIIEEETEQIKVFISGYEENKKPFLLIDNTNNKINTTPHPLKRGDEDLNYKTYKGINIIRRIDNRYQARFTIAGKRKTIYGQTRRDCYEKLKEFLGSKKVIYDKKLSFFEYWEYWYKSYKEPFIKEGTLKNYRSVLKNQIKPNIEDKEIKKFTSLDINLLLKKLPNNRMKEYASQYLVELFRQAYKDKKIPTDICEDIRKYHHKRTEGTALTLEQREVLLDRLKKIKHGNIFKFYLFSGVRPAEALSITPKDIEGQFIHVRGTKTNGSDRYIPKFSQLEEVLNKIDINQETIFNISEATLKRERIRLCALCGFNFKTKDLRTTFATMCAEKGISPRTIAKWLGHTTTSTTNKYYIKVLDNYELEQIKLVDTNFDTTKST